MTLLFGLSLAWFGCAAATGERAAGAAAVAATCTGCDSSASPVGSLLLQGGTVVGFGPADVLIQDGRITSIGSGISSDGADVLDVSGRYLVPGFIDSHVHLAYLPEAEEMLDKGVVGAVDLASPIGFLTEDHGSMQIIGAGPMVTAVGGYPTRSWGSGGYGMECANTDAAITAVDTLFSAGARVIKLPLAGEPELSSAALSGAAARAHEHGMKVASHALGDEEALAAAEAGVDVLAHTPTASLSDAAVQAWAQKAVISTLAAFGGGSATVANLAELRSAGAIVLYGTDFGNRSAVGIDAREVELLLQSGMSPAQILASATSVPAAYFGFDGLGSITAGNRGSVVVLDRDPTADATALSEPLLVVVDGVARQASLDLQ